MSEKSVDNLKNQVYMIFEVPYLKGKNLTLFNQISKYH